jgi:hypothetical protein
MFALQQHLANAKIADAPLGGEGPAHECEETQNRILLNWLFALDHSRVEGTSSSLNGGT